MPDLPIDPPADPLQLIWQRNLPRLQTRLDLLDRAAQAIATSTLTPELRAQALDTAHKLSGSLGMFGHHQATEIARQIEHQLESPTPTHITPLTRQLRQTLFP